MFNLYTHSVSHAHFSDTFSLRGVQTSRTRMAQNVCSAHVISLHLTLSILPFGLKLFELESWSTPMAGAMVKKRHRLQQKTLKMCTVQDGSLKERLVKLMMTESPQCNRVNLQAVLDILLQKNHAERSDFVENTLGGKGPASPSAKVDCIRTKAGGGSVKPTGEDGVRTLTHQWIGPDGQQVPVLQSDQIFHSAGGVVYLNMAKLAPMLAANICSPRPLALVTRGSLADLQKLERGKQIINQYRVCEVSYTYVCSDDKILPARGLLLQIGTGDVKQRETKHDFEVPVDSHVEMTLTLRRDWSDEALWTKHRKRSARDSQ